MDGVYVQVLPNTSAFAHLLCLEPGITRTRFKSGSFFGCFEGAKRVFRLCETVLLAGANEGFFDGSGKMSQ